MTDIQDDQQNSPIAPSLQELAGLMDLDLGEDDPSPTDDFGADNQFDDEASDLDNDVFDNEEFNPEKNRTIISFQNSGVAKAAVVGGGSLAVILGGMTIFQGQLPKEPVAQVVKKKDSADNKVASAQAALTKAQQSESATKAQLALAKQKDSLAQAQLNNPGRAKSSQGQTVPDTTTVAKTGTDNSQPVIIAPLPRSSQVNNVTPLAPAIQPLSRPEAPIAKAQNVTSPASTKWVTVAASNSQPTRSSARMKQHRYADAAAIASVQTRPNYPAVAVAQSLPVPDGQIVATKTVQKPIARAIAVPGISSPINNSTVDANTELQQLAAVGRYGMVSAAVELPTTSKSDLRFSAGDASRSNNARGSSPMTVAMVPNLPPLAQYFQRYAGQESSTDAANITTQSPGMIAVNSARPAFTNSQEMIQGAPAVKSGEKDQIAAKSSNIELPNPIRALLVGTSAKGSAVTPVLWGGGANSSARFLLKLDEPMLDGNNREAFPAGTQFVVTAKPAHANIGLAELEVISVIIKGMEFAPPAGSIAIRDEQGGLLMGEDYFKRDEQIANRDMMSVFTGALSGVGRILNQPVSTVASSFNGTTANTTNIITNREPNILGAVLEGGFKDLSAVWSQRNQQAIQELASKPNVYQIPSGRTVRVFVNQSMTF